MSKSNLTAERLRELLHYDPETGVFTRRLDARRWKAGETVGSKNKRHGYVIVGIEREFNWAHRLAWLYVHGVWPTGDIDHIDGDRGNNRISNLRDVPHRLNSENRKAAQINNALGVLGVSQRRGSFRATIKRKGVQIHIGDFPTLEEASAAYLRAKREFHEGNTL